MRYSLQFSNSWLKSFLGLSPEVLFGQKLDVDREPLSPPSEVVGIGQQNNKTLSASDEISVASMAMESFRRGNGKSATEHLEKGYSSRNVSATSKTAHRSFTESFPSSHEEEDSVSTPISAEDITTATPSRSQEDQTTVTVDNDDEETTSPRSVGITHNEEIDSPVEKLTVLPDEISLEAAQSPDSVVLDGEDIATTDATNTITKSPISRNTSTAPSKRRKLPAPRITEPKPSAVIKQPTAKNVLKVIDEIEPKPRRVVPNRELRVR